MNLLGNKVPQLVILVSIVYQDDGVKILTTSQLGNFAVALICDPDDTMLVKIDDEDRLDELVAFFALIDNVP